MICIARITGDGMGPRGLSQGDQADLPLAGACLGLAAWGATALFRLQWTHPTPSTTAVHGGCRVRRRSRVTQPPDASPHGKAPLGRPVWVPGWLPWAGLSTWRPCAARAAVGARTPDQPTHRGRRGYMSAQGVPPSRSTVSIASKRDGSGQSVALASSDSGRVTPKALRKANWG